jgi:hypothetical protein
MLGIKERRRNRNLENPVETLWRPSHRFDPEVVPIADRHYNRQKIGSPQFVKPGRCIVLKIGTRTQLRNRYTGGAFWTTSWPFAEYVKHEWAGAWECSAFRNEGAGLSSDLIREAIAITRGVWEPPDLGMITMVNEEKTLRGRSSRSKPGKCFLEAGFVHVGKTKKDELDVLQMLPCAMPKPIIIESAQGSLFQHTAA